MSDTNIIDDDTDYDFLKPLPRYEMPSPVSPITPLPVYDMSGTIVDELELPPVSDTINSRTRYFPKAYDGYTTMRRGFYNTSRKKDPVVSCGIICFLKQSIELYKDTNNIDDLRILLVRRKDSLAYVEFIRGKYKPSDPMYIRSLLRSMTHEEHQKILTMEFEELWTDMWKSKPTKTHMQEYMKSVGRFNDAKESIRDFLRKNPNEGEREPEWTFPKGRVNKHEANFNCALREFREETNIHREKLVVNEEQCLSETYTGTNGIVYMNYFYIGTTDVYSLYIQPNNMFQQKEVSAIEWVSATETEERIKHIYPSRIEILREAISRILATTE